MTPGRRTLRFENLDDIMADVERLMDGHTTVGTWSLAQICRHLATATRRVVDLPASTPHDPTHLVSEEQKRRVLESGALPEGLPGPPEIMPGEALGEREQAEGLRAALDHYRASPGPVVPHRFFGRLTREEWDRLVLIHCAHHLSFAIPR
jgi:hypothetical protein